MQNCSKKKLNVLLKLKLKQNNLFTWNKINNKWDKKKKKKKKKILNLF